MINKKVLGLLGVVVVTMAATGCSKEKMDETKQSMKDAAATGNMLYDEEAQRRNDRLAQTLNMPVTNFELSVRSRNCLQKMGIDTIGDLTRTSEAELLSSKNFGETSLREIKAILAQKGLSLGQMIEDGSRHKKIEPNSDEQSEIDSDGAKNVPLSEASFSVRVRSGLEHLGAVILGDVAGYSEQQLLKCKNFGRTSLEEVKLRLAEHGLSLREDPSVEDPSVEDSNPEDSSQQDIPLET